MDVDDFLLIWIVPVLVGILWYFISQIIVSSPGVALQRKFQSLGTLTGKTLSEIQTVCGNPSARSALGNGETLYQWQATGYLIALVFDENDICKGISSEIAS